MITTTMQCLRSGKVFGQDRSTGQGTRRTVSTQEVFSAVFRVYPPPPVRVHIIHRPTGNGSMSQ